MSAPRADAHYPGRAAIDAYGGGGFRFADMSHRGSILCLPSGIWAWEPAQPLDEASFTKVLAEADEIEFLLVGTGRTLVPLPEQVRWALRARRISADPMATGAAVRTYNIVLGEGRRAAAALIAVD